MDLSGQDHETMLFPKTQEELYEPTTSLEQFVKHERVMPMAFIGKRCHSGRPSHEDLLCPTHTGHPKRESMQARAMACSACGDLACIAEAASFQPNAKVPYRRKPDRGGPSVRSGTPETSRAAVSTVGFLRIRSSANVSQQCMQDARILPPRRQLAGVKFGVRVESLRTQERFGNR
ncbi:hypothetical protein VTK56DRAFT_361 [Thermocarpiscus australiensis]